MGYLFVADRRRLKERFRANINFTFFIAYVRNRYSRGQIRIKNFIPNSSTIRKFQKAKFTPAFAAYFYLTRSRRSIFRRLKSFAKNFEFRQRPPLHPPNTTAPFRPALQIRTNYLRIFRLSADEVVWGVALAGVVGGGAERWSFEPNS